MRTLSCLLLLAALPTAVFATNKGGEPGTGSCVAALGCQVVRPGFFDCDNSSITQALAAGATQVRVVAGSSAETVAIADRSVEIIGGYASCQAARDGVLGAAGATSQINAGGAAATAVNITATSASVRSVTLRRLAITGSNGASQGALRIVGLAGQGFVSPLQVTLVDSRVFGNTASNGGGVWLRDAQLFLTRTSIDGNHALQRGGGVHCIDARVRLTDLRSGIKSNDSLSHGGGLYAEGCDVTLHGGMGAALFFADGGGVLDNQATLGSGGGVYAAAGTYVEIGPNLNPGLLAADISANRANPDDLGSNLGGGGVFATGAGTRINIAHTRFDANTAGGASTAAGGAGSVGGAIALTAGAQLEIVRVGMPLQCDPANVTGGLYPGLCTRFFANRSSGAGGALFANNATVSMTGVYVHDNANGPGGVLQFAGSGAKSVDTALLRDNVAHSAARPATQAIGVDSGNAVVRLSTIADGGHSQAAIGLGIASVEIRGVLVDDRRWMPPPALAYDLSAPPQVFCLQAHEAASLPASQVRSGTGDSRWTPAQRDANDVHLRYDGTVISDMLDGCALSDVQGLGTAPGVDADGEPRGFDIVALGNIGGAFDVGVDEFIAAAVFADGFE